MGILEGKVAVVTGGGAGIGAAICHAFAAAGAGIVVADIDRAKAEAVAARLSGFPVAADVRLEDSVVALFAACEAHHGRLDILVNNAGVVPPQTAVWDMSLDEWEEVMAVNLRGAFLCIKHAMPLLKRQGGSIINMSSRMGLHGGAMRSHYSASKFALRGLTESAAQEAGPLGVRVNSICPGSVDTEALRARIAERAARTGVAAAEIADKSFAAPAALRRMVRPDEVAGTALFLASDAAGAITGEHIRIDAGR